MNPANNANKGRRVTDKEGSLLDAATQAVRMERMEGEHRLLQSQVKQSIDTLSSTLGNLQLETRTVLAKLSELAGLQNAHDSNKVSIDEVKRSVGELNTRLEEWFDDFDQRNQRRWELYEANRDSWRRQHEAENENSARDLEKEIRSVRETTIRFAAFGAAVVFLGGTIVGGFIYNINYRFNEGKEDLQDAVAASTYNRQLIDGTMKELVDIKLYLARGGRIPEEPYIPQSQRNHDGQQDARKPAK